MGLCQSSAQRPRGGFAPAPATGSQAAQAADATEPRTERGEGALGPDPPGGLDDSPEIVGSVDRMGNRRFAAAARRLLEREPVVDFRRVELDQQVGYSLADRFGVLLAFLRGGGPRIARA